MGDPATIGLSIAGGALGGLSGKGDSGVSDASDAALKFAKKLYTTGSTRGQAGDTFSWLQSGLGQEYYNPIKAGIINPMTTQLSDFMQGNFDVSSSPVYGSGKVATEDAYATAKDQLLANLPAGGPVAEGMMNLEGSRARSLVDLASQISQDQYNKAYGLATTAPQTALAAYQGAGNQYNADTAAMLGAGQTGQSGYNTSLQSALYQNQSNNQLMGSMGQGIGMLLGGKPSGGGGNALAGGKK